MLQQLSEPQKIAGDVLAGVGGISALLGVFTGVFGAIAALGSAVYAWIRVYEWYVTRKNK